MKRIYFLTILMLSLSSGLMAQADQQKPAPTGQGGTVTEKKQPLFGIAFSGFVKTDIFFDSRQTINLRDGHFLLFPENKKLDADGADINAKASYNFLSIQTRLAGTITGPDALGAKTSAYIEAEFFGNINPNINTFRLRHAWIKLAWKSTELLAGQWWHPMFVPECSPATVSFNTGAPFVVFSRNPQVKLTQRFGKVNVALTFLSQVDFVSDGPDGASSKYLRNSVLPETNLQIQYGTKSASGTEFLVGGGVNYQLLTPRLSTTVTLASAYDTVINGIVFHHEAETATYKTGTTIDSWAGNLYAKLRLNKITLKAGGEIGQNNNSYTMIGGYAVKTVTDSARNLVDYTNIKSYAIWAEFHTNSAKWQPGLFLAYAQNLGSGEILSGPYYARGNNIGYAYRISPRLVVNINKLRLAGELEYTVAAYGKVNEKGFVHDTEEIGNLRVLLGIYYFF